jgi:hypothetical protein
MPSLGLGVSWLPGFGGRGHRAVEGRHGKGNWNVIAWGQILLTLTPTPVVQSFAVLFELCCWDCDSVVLTWDKGLYFCVLGWCLQRMLWAAARWSVRSHQNKAAFSASSVERLTQSSTQYCPVPLRPFAARAQLLRDFIIQALDFVKALLVSCLYQPVCPTWRDKGRRGYRWLGW